MKLVADKSKRHFVCYIHFIGVDNISLGVTVNWHCPNIELHLPFCFIKVGWAAVYRWKDGVYKTWGKDK